MPSPTAVVCAYSSVGTAALEGLLEAGVEVLALYTYAQAPDEHWFTPPLRWPKLAGFPSTELLHSMTMRSSRRLLPTGQTSCSASTSGR